MTILLLLFSLVRPEAAIERNELAFTIERDHDRSSDHVTLCRVRVVNYGARSWSGRSIAFEARAIRDGAIAETERGRFGLTLLPYGSLETLIGFTGRFDRFEVVPVRGAAGEKRSRADSSGRGRSRGGGSRTRGRTRKGPP
jgi:hypothetical protein